MNGTVNFMSLNTFLHSLSTSTEQNLKKGKKKKKKRMEGKKVSAEKENGTRTLSKLFKKKQTMPVWVSLKTCRENINT